MSLVRFLVLEAGAEVDAVDGGGRSALWAAAAADRDTVASFLIEQGDNFGRFLPAAKRRPSICILQVFWPLFLFFLLLLGTDHF